MLELTPIETVSPAIDRATSPQTPAPMRLMAAKGLAPLPPADLLVALYQLSFASEDAIKQAAFKTAIDLPEKVLSGALAGPLDARVLDFFAARVFQKPALLEIVLLNRATADETFAYLASVCDEAGVEFIAKNEERLLRTPAIIAAIYLNKKARMSTAQRAVELAVRNNVVVEGIPAFEDVAEAIAESGEVDPADDAAFATAAAELVDEEDGGLLLLPTEAEAAASLEAAERLAIGEGLTPEEEKVAEKKKVSIKDLKPAQKVRLATLGNAFARAVLIRDKNKQVSMAAIKSPAITDPEVVKYATDRSLDKGIINQITKKRSWMKIYSVKVALINNPKCSLEMAMHLLPHLTNKDLKMLSRSKGVPSSLTGAAKKLLKVRGGEKVDE